jgi:hypothetical protein
MSLLKLAVEKERWDLAAHTIVLAAVRALNGGGQHAGRKRPKKCLKAPVKR